MSLAHTIQQQTRTILFKRVSMTRTIKHLLNHLLKATVSPWPWNKWNMYDVCSQKCYYLVSTKVWHSCLCVTDSSAMSRRVSTVEVLTVMKLLIVSDSNESLKLTIHSSSFLKCDRTVSWHSYLFGAAKHLISLIWIRICLHYVWCLVMSSC